MWEITKGLTEYTDERYTVPRTEYALMYIWCPQGADVNNMPMATYIDDVKIYKADDASQMATPSFASADIEPAVQTTAISGTIDALVGQTTAHFVSVCTEDASVMFEGDAAVNAADGSFTATFDNQQRKTAAIN